METRPFSAAFLNRKGGVGKSSSVFHLAGTLAGPMGLKVLVCDLDPQGSLSQGYFGPIFVERLPKEKTVAALFDDAYDPSPDELILPTGIENISILPANNELTDHNTSKPELSPYQNSLKDFLDEVRNQFDVILVDCPPNLQLCSWAALLGCDFVVIPVVPEDFSSQGLVYVQQAIDQAMTTSNPRLRLLGYMLTLLDSRLTIHSVYAKLLRDQYQDLVFEQVMPASTVFKEAVSDHKPVVRYKPKSPAAEATSNLCREMLSRAPEYGKRRAEFYYVGNRYVPGIDVPQAPELDQVVASEEGN